MNKRLNHGSWPIPAMLILQRIGICLSIPLLLSCGTIPQKKFFLINYLPSPPTQRLSQAPYSYTIRLKDFEIEAAYARPQIVYRQSPFELQYDFYRIWAVKPSQMITDLVHKHLATANLVSSVTRRYDEGATPHYEMSGNIEALEEYDSDKAWFAHIALRLDLMRISDGATIYSRRFDQRKQVYQSQPELVIREMSVILDNIMNLTVLDLDTVFSREAGIRASSSNPNAEMPPPITVDSLTR